MLASQWAVARLETHFVGTMAPFLHFILSWRGAVHKSLKIERSCRFSAFVVLDVHVPLHAIRSATFMGISSIWVE